MATTAAQDEYNELFRDKTKRNHHPTDSPLERSDAASSHADDSDNDRSSMITAATSRPANSSSANNANGRYIVPRQRHMANTGVKGVITDAQAYREAARTRQRGTDSPDRADRERSIQATQPYIVGALSEAQVKSGLSDDDDVEDEDFMNQWRQNRLAELQGGQRIGTSGKEKDARKAKFGGLVPVDGMGYLDAVDGSGSVTVVVVYIYDNQSEVSDLIEEHIVSLARKYVNTRFIKLHYRDAEMEPAGVPAVLAYRGGEKFAGMVPLLDEIPDDADVNAQTMEMLFQKHQIL